MKRQAIERGYIIGSLLSITIYSTVALGLIQIPNHRLLSWMGAIPIALGIYALIRPKGVDAELEVAANISTRMSGFSPMLQFTVLAIVLSIDDFGVYIPLLTSMELGEIFIMIAVAVIGLIGIIAAGKKISDTSSVKKMLDKVERWLVPVLFIVIGLYTLINGQFDL